jgi:transcriptional regulator with XRE-family HTH domain
VLGRARAQVVQELAPVHLHHVARLVEDRDHQRAIEVLVAALADQAHLLQARPDVGTGLARFLRQPQPQRAVGHAQLEGGDQLRVRQAARGQVGQRLRAVLQSLVVVVEGLAQERPVIGIEGDRRRQGAHRRSLGLARRSRRLRRVGLEQLHGMAERHAARLHDPVDRPATDLAAEAVPQVLARTHHQARLAVIVEGAATQPVLARLLELDARGLDQALHAHLVFQPLQLGLRNTRHATLRGFCTYTTLLNNLKDATLYSVCISVKPRTSMHPHPFLDLPHRLEFFSPMGKRLQTLSTTVSAKPAKDDPAHFGARLATLRKAAGFTQVELAAELGISQRMVAYYESPAATPPANLLPQLAVTLGVSIDELFGVGAPKRRLVKQDGDSRLRRRLLAIEKLDVADKRQVLQLIDAFIERGQLKRKVESRT